MLDWGTPTSMDKYLDFDDYVNGYLDYYVEYIKMKHQLKNFITRILYWCNIATAYASLHPER